jgi:transposase InsO family protein
MTTACLTWTYAANAYFRFYNHERLHQSLAHRTPAEVHFA